MLNELIIFLATAGGLGAGLPASVVALCGCPLALLMLRWGLLRQLVLVGLCLAVAFAVCDRAAVHLGSKDPPIIVADEYLTFPVAVLGIRAARNPVFLAGAFLTTRLLDGLKPPPARQVEALTGGLGIVADDAIANVYALALHALVSGLRRKFRKRPSGD